MLTKEVLSEKLSEKSNELEWQNILDLPEHTFFVVENEDTKYFKAADDYAVDMDDFTAAFFNDDVLVAEVDKDLKLLPVQYREEQGLLLGCLRGKVVCYFPGCGMGCGVGCVSRVVQLSSEDVSVILK